MTNCFQRNNPGRRTHTANILNFLVLLIISGSLFISYSCEEPSSQTGKALIPASDNVDIESTLLKVKSYTMYSDSIESMMQTISYLGEKYDPWFGTTRAEFVSQLRLDEPWEYLFYEIDSMRLYLRLLSVEGDTADPHFLRMSEISETIYTDEKYFSGQTIGLTGYTVGDIPLPTLKADTINNIVLNVDNSFGEYILRDTKYLQYDSLDFREFFKGLHFQILSPEDPIFVSLSVTATNSDYYSNYFVIYMNNGLGAPMEYVFRIDAVTPNAVFNIYRHDHTTAEPDKELKHINDTTYLDTLSYAQTFNGVFTKLVLTGLDSIKNIAQLENISVNRARLKIPVYYDGFTFSRTTIPSSLYLRYLTSSGKVYLLPEVGTSFYDGMVDTTATFAVDDVYNLNIATFVQGYLDDTSGEILPELEMFILPTIRNNVILKANGASRPVRFEFTYTKF
ncbi:MAG: DUF4270 family protein [Bacteroidales bacterium]|nr:DUF4270 family protein [Bacteroidales bacterium]MBN2632745.1 DUF4270 family protein [Bacteroidales bacterium]